MRLTVEVTKFLILVLIIIAGFGQAVHYLWNLLMPQIFGLRAIGFWQAVGLLGLSWHLFGGFGWFGGPRRRFSRRGNPMAERWEKMTPEERAKFRAGLRYRCGPAERQGEAET